MILPLQLVFNGPVYCLRLPFWYLDVSIDDEVSPFDVVGHRALHRDRVGDVGVEHPQLPQLGPDRPTLVLT